MDERGTAALTAGAGCALNLEGNVVCVPPGQLRIDLFLRAGEDVVTNDMAATTAEVPRLKRLR